MKVEVNQETCIRCGACVEVCPMEVFQMTVQGPQEGSSRLCIACGHCVAVCPVAALDIEKAPLKEQVPILEGLKISAEQAEQFLRSRRSTRRYLDEAVSKEKLEKILNIARLAPTGSNSQGTQFMVIENAAKMDELREQMADFFEKGIQNGTVARGYRKIFESYRKGKDVFFRGAPQLMVALNEENAPAREPNGQFAFTYAELFAPSIGVGTCWAGFFMWYAKYSPQKVAELLGIPAGWKITAALMVGNPQYSYRRLPEREPLQVFWR